MIFFLKILIFAHNIDCGYTLVYLSEAVLTSTHNLCFEAKIRKNVYPCKPQFHYIKVGCKGVFVTRTCFRDNYSFLHLEMLYALYKNVKSMQRSETETIRTQIQPKKPKWEITTITNSQKTKRTYGQPSEQLFPNRWPLSNRNRTKNNRNTHKVKCHRNSDNKNRQQRTTTKLPH